MVSDFFKGASCALAGFSLIQKRGIKRYVLIPLLLNIGLFALLLWYLYGRADTGIALVVGWLPDWLDWLSWLLWILLAALLLLVVFYTFTLVVNFIGSPFNGFLAERLEQQLTALNPPSSGRVIGTLSAIKNAVTSELNKLGYLLSRSLPLLILSFIPVINIAAPALWLLFGAWMLTLEYMDYPMGNHGIPFAEQRQTLKRHRGLALGFGLVILVMTLVPLLNFFAMPVAVAGATQLWVKHLAGKSP